MPYTRKEERWNTWSHAIGIIIALVAGTSLLILTIHSESPWPTVGVALYFFGMMASYTTSTIYHSLPQQTPAKEQLRRWDHAAIYWHIAGSYSPVTLVALRNDHLWGWSLFGFVWAAALAGTIASFRRLEKHSNIETASFCLMGLSVLIAFKPLLNDVSTTAVLWILAEGFFYIAGALFYTMHRIRYMHTIFHFFVLAGTICHIAAVRDILMQYLQS